MNAAANAFSRTKELLSQGQAPWEIFVNVIAEAAQQAGTPLAPDHLSNMRQYLSGNELAFQANDVIVAIASMPSLAKWATQPQGTPLPLDVECAFAYDSDGKLRQVVKYMEFIAKTAPFRQSEIFEELKKATNDAMDQTNMMDQTNIMRCVLYYYN